MKNVIINPIKAAVPVVGVVQYRPSLYCRTVRLRAIEVTGLYPGTLDTTEPGLLNDKN